MARNATFTLTSAQTEDVARHMSYLPLMVGHMVEVTFTKRDGTPSVINGEVLAVVGATADKYAVTVGTERGPRSANVWAIDDVVILD